MKRTLEKNLKDKATDGGYRRKPHSWVNTSRRANNRSEYAPQCTQRRGWSSDNSTCKTTAAKFTKCLEFKSVWHCSLARTNQRQPVCTHVEVRSPPAPFVPGVVNTALSFHVRSDRSHTTNIFYNLLILQDESIVSTLSRGGYVNQRVKTMQIRRENYSDGLSA